MSFQAYADDHLMCDIEGNHLTSAAILGHDGTVSFPQIKPDEVAAMMKDFDEPGTLAHDSRSMQYGCRKDWRLPC